MNQDDFFNQAIRRACELAEQTGEITFDQLNELLPSAQVSPEQIEQLLHCLTEKGFRVVDNP